MRPDRMTKHGLGIWRKWMRKVPKNMRWNENYTQAVGRSTIKQKLLKEYDI